MAGKTIPMNIIKQLLIKIQQDVSIKQMARDLDVSRNTIKRYLNLIQECEYEMTELISKDEMELDHLFNIKTSVSKDHLSELQSTFPTIQKELKRTGVTLTVLWSEYRQLYPQGYSYSQYCWHYQQWNNSQNTSMIMPHKAADKVYVDFAGKKLQYSDLHTGEVIDVEFYAGILGYSQYCFACVVESQNMADFIEAGTKMLEHFGGSPQAIVIDNLKSGITKSDRYEPEVTRSFSDFCNHYEMATLPARVRKPKDKSLVEGVIRILYTRVYAPLRNQTFHSLEEINTAINGLLDKHNQMPMTNKGLSRFELFMKEEKELLKSLPTKAFEIKYYRTATVQRNCHVVLTQDKHYYSVPMRYIGNKVNLIYTASNVSIYYERQLVAFHPRRRRLFEYSTIAEHLPSQHQYILGLTPEFFIQWGNNIDQQVGQYIKLLIERKNHPEQAYKSCQGIQSLSRKLGNDKLKQAVIKGIELGVYNYKFIKSIMERPPSSPSTKGPVLPIHENIRGACHYQ